MFNGEHLKFGYVISEIHNSPVSDSGQFLGTVTPLPHGFRWSESTSWHTLDSSSMVERLPVKEMVVGSSPTFPAKTKLTVLSSSGLGHWIFIPKTRVRVPEELLQINSTE